METYRIILLILTGICTVLLILLIRDGYKRGERVINKASSQEVIDRYKRMYKLGGLFEDLSGKRKK